MLATLALFMALCGPSYATGVVKRAVNADKVDGLHASKTPKAKRLLPLNAQGKLPASALPTGTAGAPGPQGLKVDTGDTGAQGPAGPTDVRYVTANLTATATALSGGQAINSVYPVDGPDAGSAPDGWYVAVSNEETHGHYDVIYAVCVKATSAQGGGPAWPIIDIGRRRSCE